MALKFLLITCFVAYASAGFLPSSLQYEASPQIRYAPSAPLISKSTIYHSASASAPITYHASAPAAVTYHAPAPITYHSSAPATLTYHAAAPAAYTYHAQSPGAINYHAAPSAVTYQSAPAAITYHAPAPATVSYHAAVPVVKSVASAPALTYQAAPVLKAAPVVRAVAAAPVVKTVASAPALIKAQADEEYDPNPQYSFAYDVQDSLTGDWKSQSETRNGDSVQGSYSLNEPDGTRRIVDYTADPVNGFNAVVRKESLGEKAIIAPVAKIAAAPVTKIISH